MNFNYYALPFRILLYLINSLMYLGFLFTGW